MDQDIEQVVRERYGAAAQKATEGQRSSCCGGGQAGTDAEETDGGCCADKKATVLGGTDPICRDLYGEGQTAGLPEETLLASFGCGNPTALAELKEGETVLDLGSGGGIDVLLSARRVGKTGRAYGLDMTDEMLSLAESNRRKAGATNVQFLRGSIEQIPLPDASVDVIISNCVINLASDKSRVLKEAFRVLKPGGRFAVSDMVLQSELPKSVRASINLWSGCVAGALVKDDYLAKLNEAGFRSASIETTRTYSLDDAREMAGQTEDGAPSEEALRQMAGSVSSAFIRASKPKGGCCCGG